MREIVEMGSRIEKGRFGISFDRGKTFEEHEAFTTFFDLLKQALTLGVWLREKKLGAELSEDAMERVAAWMVRAATLSTIECSPVLREVEKDDTLPVKSLVDFCQKLIFSLWEWRDGESHVDESWDAVSFVRPLLIQVKGALIVNFSRRVVVEGGSFDLVENSVGQDLSDVIDALVGGTLSKEEGATLFEELGKIPQQRLEKLFRGERWGKMKFFNALRGAVMFELNDNYVLRVKWKEALREFVSGHCEER